MREEVRKLFDHRALELEKLVQKCPYGLSEREIAFAMEQVYDRIKSGEKIRPIRIGWTVWEQARANNAENKLDVPTYQEIQETRAESKKLNKSVYRLSLWLYISLFLNIAMIGAWFYFYGRAYL